MDPFKSLKLDLAIVLLLAVIVSLLIAGIDLADWQESLLLGGFGLVGAGFLILRTLARVRQLRHQASAEDLHGAKQEQ